MPRYYLHIYDSYGIAADEEGHDLPDLAAARSAAIEGIRCILSETVREGVMSFGGRIVIMDAWGHVVATVPFAEAVSIDAQSAESGE